MSPGKQIYHLGLVGAGRQGMAILEALVPARRDDQPLRMVGVADLNPEAPGILYAYRHNLFVTVNFADLLQLPELDIIVNATGRPEVTEELQAHCPEGVSVLNCDRPHYREGFLGHRLQWFILHRRNFPLKIGIVGGGRGCQKVLQQMAGDCAIGRGLTSSGWPIPIPRPGHGAGEEIGYSDVWGMRLPLGGKSRPDSGTHRGPAGAGKNHPTETGPTPRLSTISKSRLFWELFKKEEDRLRIKVESEIKLADQRSHFQRIFDYLPDPVLVLNPDYTVEEVNQTFLNRFQKKAGEVIGKHCYEVFHQLDEPCDRQGMVCPLPQVVKEC